MDLSRVIIGHSGDTTDLGYLEELIAAGSYLGMDRFGLHNILSFDDRVDTVARLCERGHADKMVLSHDASCYIDWLPEAALPVALPDWHFLHIHQDVLPALRQRASPRSRSPPCSWTTRGPSSPGAADERRDSPIGTRLSQLAAEDPDRPAITCDGRTLTRRELESAANRLARAYAELGSAAATT